MAPVAGSKVAAISHCLGGEPSAGPPAVRLSLVPVHVHHRVPRLERHDDAESGLVPTPEVTANPEERVLAALPPTPVPPAAPPHLAPPISAVVDERPELGIRHRCRRDPKWPHLDGMSPLLIVEQEPLIALGPRPERPAWHRDVVGAPVSIDGRAGPGRIEARESRQGDPSVCRMSVRFSACMSSCSAASV